MASAGLQSIIALVRRRVPELEGPADGSGPRFSLLRWFAVLSLICIILISAATASFLSSFLKEQMLARDAIVSMEFINSIVHAEKTWWYFDNEVAVPPREPVASFFTHIADLPDVMRANVYSRERVVLWSSTTELIGQRFGRNDDLDKALRGKIAVDSGTVGDSKSEHIAFDERVHGTRFVEVYLPIWDQRREAVIGVVELYKLPRALFEAIDQGEALVWTSAAIGALFLWLSLFWIVRRADRLIHAQHEQLVSAERLATIGEMASAVAHGIRNPLASIRSSAELARGEELPVAQECLTDIMREADRLSGWVRDLLQHIRGEPAPAERLDLDLLVRRTLVRVSGALERQGIRLSIDSKHGPAFVRASPEALTHVLNSLIANAIEAMPRGGTLRVTTECTNGTAQLDILDTGPGIPRQLRKKLFRPFFTTKPNGVGLGLVLARRAVGRYSGTLELVSEEGRGTRVMMRLPAADGGR